GVQERGEHFKRLRNAYSEWRTWADDQTRAGRPVASCQDCHMSLYPGTCEPGPASATSGAASASGSPIGKSCPSGTHFSARAPGEFPEARMSPTSSPRRAASHYFTSVDIPLTPSYPDAFVDDASLDAFNLPIGLRGRRDMLLRKAFSFSMDEPRRVGSTLEIPLRIENTGAGHRVPAGFSQEREIWVELTVTDARGDVVYQVGKIATEDADLQDKVFLRVSTSEQGFDNKGRPLGIFGADVADGPDVPRWSPNPQRGGTTFRGRGLVNFQNGFFRCVRCIGVIDERGACQPGPGQGRTRADRFDDGLYDLDTGECRSNLSGGNELFETYFPVGALDADRGITKAPDAIIDTRSAAPNVPLRYTYEIDVGRHSPPFQVDARLRFRSFPPFLVKAFADYEAKKNAARQRPSGAQVTRDMLRRLEVVDLADAHARTDR
ncbi:MAG: Serine/threonine-protein kinase PknA, partial [Myxococcaceae bacterium]|nr:Serine/threonine-protein kinase PknA [Myxococcaceae bacterium]